MQQYLGISMVVIVITMCVGILSTIVSENIFKQIEAHKDRSRAKMARLLSDTLSEATKYVGKYIQYIKEAKKLDEEEIHNKNEIVKEAFNKTINEMIDDKKS